jgi:hypothetical protein
MPLTKRILRSPAIQSVIGSAAAWYLRLVWYSSRRVVEPADFYETMKTPIIVALWHGQHLLTPFLKQDDARDRGKVLISRHRDGEINARAAAKLGLEPIRGSGSHDNDFRRKGGASAFHKMLDALADGYNIGMTADVPKVARVSGLGIVKLAQHSGRPIHAIAIASSRRIDLKNWDRTAINLPLSRIALVAGDALYVPSAADDATLEAARQQVESDLNRVTARAYAIVDRTGSAP